MTNFEKLLTPGIGIQDTIAMIHKWQKNTNLWGKNSAGYSTSIYNKKSKKRKK